jgi:hypothetical protein
MDITMIGLQNAGKTSLLRVLAVSPFPFWMVRMLGRYAATRPRSLTAPRVENLLSSTSTVPQMRELATALFRQCLPLLPRTTVGIVMVVHALILGYSSIPTVGFNMKRVQKGHVTLKW